MATFVFVHGACHGGWCWEKLTPLLRAMGHTTHAPDLPGLGKDHTPPASVTLADNVDKIARKLDTIDEPVILVGHSLGGVTISQLAEARRRKIKALVARTQLPTLFYEDVPFEDRYRAMERLRPQPVAISSTPVTLTEERFGSVARWYIECTYDNAILIRVQRRMVALTPCKVITMECGHSPFYSNPEELAEHLDKIARA